VIASPSSPIILSRSPERSEEAAKNLIALRTGSGSNLVVVLEIASSLVLLAMTLKVLERGKDTVSRESTRGGR
jgi:hypothetical protein